MLFRTFDVTNIEILHNKVETVEDSAVSYVPLRMPALQLGDNKNDRMMAPYGLSRLFPGEKETYTRNLSLVVSDPRVLEQLGSFEEFFQNTYAQHSRTWCKKTCVLEYNQMTKESEHGTLVTVKVNVTDHHDPTPIKIFDADKQPSEWAAGSEADLAPGSECLVFTKPDSIWLGPKRYGVVLKAKTIIVKVASRPSYGIEDMIL
jgi:hypothetical protein